MKKLSLLLFAVITAILSNSCSKEEAKTSDFTGYYNSKSVYQNDLLLRTVSSTGTSSFFGSGSGNDLNINTNLYVSKITGLKSITRINKTLDSIHVYELDKPELGGLLYVIKNNIVSVHQFEFVGPKNKINPTFHYITLPIPAGRYQLSKIIKNGKEGNKIEFVGSKNKVSTINYDTKLPIPVGRYQLSKTNESSAESIIDNAIEKYYEFTQTIGSSEILESIKESLSNAKDNAIKILENAQNSRTESSDYLDKQVDKNPEPIKLPLEENPTNKDEQKVIDDESFDCNTSTLAMTISDPNVINGVATVRARGIGGDGNYNYKWSDGQVGDYAAFSKSGTYTVTVTDGNRCSIYSSVIINVNSELGIGQNYQGGIIAYIYQIGDSQYIGGETHGIIISSTIQSSAENWQSAMTLCNNLTLNGYSDWVLPTFSLSDYLISRYGSLKFWTSQELVGPDGLPSGAYAVVIDSSFVGGGGYQSKSFTNAVIAIRYF